MWVVIGIWALLAWSILIILAILIGDPRDGA